jgi:hypothetical protein
MHYGVLTRVRRTLKVRGCVQGRQVNNIGAMSKARRGKRAKPTGANSRRLKCGEPDLVMSSAGGIGRLLALTPKRRSEIASYAVSQRAINKAYAARVAAAQTSDILKKRPHLSRGA